MVSGPAPESVTNAIYEMTKTISSYRICTELTVDITKVGTQNYNVDGRKFVLQVVDSVHDYVDYMKKIFDFPAIKAYLQDVPVLINAMHGGKQFMLH